MWVRIDKRRKGIATLVLKKGMKILKQEKCDIAHLCTDIIKLKSLYSKFGFVPLGKKYTYIGKSGKKYIEKDGMIAPVNSVTKFKEILNSSEIFNIGLGNW